MIEHLTYDKLIELLRTSGKGTKQTILKFLESATIDQLVEFRNSITLEINKRISDE